ncbi:tail length tape measure protein [Shinella sp. CPCC 101442]|uniref:tail length tape measure protein n=1 Tax=Shinella sp. CPCC 101442 TaxID=2932265 RepID=UPI0021522BDE|nr:tail length tape measure protein [Shinella sp. CPCC 101442]MCR6498411.1 tail length tape measure protein [Shinella sp. CPCC 101442]
MADNSNDDMIIAIGVDIATIRRGMKKLEQEIGSSTSKVQKQFDSLGRGIDNAMTTAMQNRINAMVGVGTKGAKEWTGALADQGKELERLRTKYSPLFATINNYKTAVADIRRAHAIGAISADEMTSAIQRERQAALASTAAIKGRNAALKDTLGGRNSGGAFNASNLAAQGFDTITTAPFMPWYTVALQQGPQVAAVFNDIKASGQSVGPAVAGAFAQIINPMSLVTIGSIAASAALIQYFSALEWGGAKSEETLKREAELVAGVVAKWGDALPALKAYNDERQKIAGDRELAEALQVGKSAQWDDLRKQMADVNVEFTALKTDIQQSSDNVDGIVALQKAFNDLQSRIDKGTATAADAKRVQDALAGFISETGIPTIADFAKQFDILAAAIANASGKAKTFDRDAAIALTSRHPSRGTYGGMERTADGTMGGIGAVLPFNGPTPERRPLIELDGLPGADNAGKKQETAAQKAANAYRDLIKSANDRIGQLQLEMELTGQYGVATDAARFRLELLQQAEDKGKSLSPTQRAEIEQKVALYEKYSQALSETKLQQDLLNAARFNSLSQTDQKVITTKRQYGLSDDLTDSNAQAIRQSLQQEEIADGFKSFAMQFSTGLISEGKSLGEAFGDAVKSAAASAMQKSLESLFSQIDSALASALMPKLGGGASGASFSATTTLGELLGAAAAPVGAVSRSALPAALPTGDIASYITQAAIKRGIDPAIALKVAKSEGGLDSWNLQSNFVKNGVREPSFGPFQLYKGGGLGNAMMKQTGLDPALAANGPAGVDFALDNAKKSGWGAWYGAAKVGVGNWDGIGKGADTAAAALEKMASASTETTKGLSSLATNLTSGIGGASGGIDLSGLFSSSFKPNTTLGNFLKGMPGFDGGGNTGMGARSGGLDGKGGFLALMHPRETVTDHTKINAPRAPRLTPSGGPRTIRNESALTVQIQGANGDDHVRMLVRQGVNEALAGQNDQMRRGGFGSVQASYQTDKG